jgi:hypothetical protein
MSFETGIFTDVDDANSIADPIVLIRAKAINLPKNLGRVWEDATIAPEQESNRKFDIYSRSETPRAGTIGVVGWDDTAVADLPVTSAVGLIKGLVLNVAGEYVVINTVDLGANTIDVRARGAAGTTAAAHLAAVAYTVVGSAIDDLDLKSIDSVSEITNEYQNYMQTVAEPIDYTKGGQIDVRKGLTSSMVRLLEEEAMTRVARNIYATTINGKKATKTASSPWMTAGLLQQLSDTTGGRVVLTYAAGGALTEAKLKEALREVTERGTPTDIYVSSANKDTINEFLGASAATKLSVNTDMGNTTAGYFVDSYNYEGLILNVKIDIGMPDDQIAIVNINKVWKGWKAGDALQLEEQPVSSTREKRSAYNGSFYLALQDVGYEHILITGITQ